jgi:hypothetical protein
MSGLLGDEEANYSRAFRLIEMELAAGVLLRLLHEAPVSHSVPGTDRGLRAPRVMVANAVSGAFSRHCHRTRLEQTVNRVDVVHCITVVLMVVVVAVFVMESRVSTIRSGGWLRISTR